MAFLRCEKLDPNPEKCTDKGREVNRCVLGLLCVGCTKEMDAYAGCMYYNTNEFNVSKRTKGIRRGMSLLTGPQKGKDKVCVHPTSPHPTCAIILGMLLSYVLIDWYRKFWFSTIWK